MRLILTGILLFICYSFQLINAQEAVSSAGGTITGNGGSVSYTVGQVAYTTISGTGGTVSQGVQQTYVISVISEVPEASEINLDLSVFPNPASQFIMLKIKNIEISNMSCLLYDANGKLLKDLKISDKLTSIPVDGLVQATYFLTVLKAGREMKVFKIVKN